MSNPYPLLTIKVMPDGTIEYASKDGSIVGLISADDTAMPELVRLTLEQAQSAAEQEAEDAERLGDLTDQVFAILEESGVPTQEKEDAIVDWIYNDVEAGIVDPHKIANRVEDGLGLMDDEEP